MEWITAIDKRYANWHFPSQFYVIFTIINLVRFLTFGRTVKSNTRRHQWNVNKNRPNVWAFIKVYVQVIAFWGQYFFLTTEYGQTIWINSNTGSVKSLLFTRLKERNRIHFWNIFQCHFTIRFEDFELFV